MKRLWFFASSAVLCLTLAAAPDYGQSSGDKKPETKQDKTKQEDKDKKKKEKPRDIFGTVELKDGSTVDCQFLAPKQVAFQMDDLGPISIPLDQLRFVEMEGKHNRISTFSRDVYVGILQTKEFKIKLLTNKKELALQRDTIKRMTFPDPPEKKEPLELIPEPKTDKKDEKDTKDKKDEKDKKDKID